MRFEPPLSRKLFPLLAAAVHLRHPHIGVRITCVFLMFSFYVFAPCLPAYRCWRAWANAAPLLECTCGISDGLYFCGIAFLCLRGHWRWATTIKLPQTCCITIRSVKHRFSQQKFNSEQQKPLFLYDYGLAAAAHLRHPLISEGCVLFVDLDLFVEQDKATGTCGKFVVLKK